jgi:hypothetical protein
VPARTASSPSDAHVCDRAAQSAAVKLLSSNSSDAACRARASRPSTAARRPPAATIPSNQSMSAAIGARLARQAAPVTRAPSRAAHASACGPPPDAPMTANRPTPSASATCATSAAADATSRPGRGVEPP